MATLQEIERAFVAAHEAGDKEGAAILANEVRRLRGGQSVAPSAPARSSGATGDFGPTVAVPTPAREPSDSDYWKDVGIRTAGAALGFPGQMAQTVMNLANAGAGSIIGGVGETLNMMLEPINKRVNYSHLLPRADYELPHNIDYATNRLRGIFGKEKAPVPAKDSTQKFLGDMTVNVGGNLLLGGATGTVKSLPMIASAITSGVLGTAGEMAGRELVPDPGKYPIAEGFLREGLPAIGSAIGGTAGAASLPRLASVVHKIRNDPEFTVEKIKNSPQLQKWMKQDIENTLRAAMKDNPDKMMANIKLAKELQQALPELKLDIGQITDSPALINEVKRLNLRSGRETEAKFNTDTKTLSMLRDQLTGKASMRPAAGRIIDDVLAREQQQMGSFMRQADDATTRQTEITGDVRRQTGVAPESIGQAIRLGRQQTQDVLQPQVRAHYDAPEQLAVSRDARYDPAPIVQSVTNALNNPRNAFGPENTPHIADLIQRFTQRNQQPGGIAFDENFNLQQRPAVQGDLDFPTLRAMRETINQDLSDARSARDPAARSRLRALGDIRRSLDETVASGDPEVARLYANANRFYAREYAHRLLTGDQAKLARTARDNVDAIPDDQIFDKFFQKGKSVPTRQFVAMANDNPQMQQTAVNGLMLKYANEVIQQNKNGDHVINLKKHDDFINKTYKHAIDVLDEGGRGNVRQRFESIASAFKAAVDAQAQAAAKVDEINTSAVMNIFRTKYGANDPYVATTEALSNRGAMGQLLMKMTKSEARQFMHYSQEVLADMLSDHLPGTETKVINPNKVRAFIDQPGLEVQRTSFEQGMARAYSPQIAKAHMENLKQISKAAEVIQRTSFTEKEVKAMKPEALGDAFKKEYGFTRLSIWASLRTMYRIQGPSYVAAVFGTQAGYTQLMHMRDAIMKQMLVNPDIAKDLRTVLESPQPTDQATSAGSRVLKGVGASSKFLYELLQPQEAFGRQAIAVSDQGEQQSPSVPIPEVEMPAWMR